MNSRPRAFDRSGLRLGVEDGAHAAVANAVLDALAELENILDIEGVSGVFMGCSDLAEVLGHPLDYLHPEVLGTVERACVEAHARGKVVLANTGYAFDSIEGQVAHARALQQAGVDMIMLQTVEFHVYLSTRAIAGTLRGSS